MQIIVKGKREGKTHALVQKLKLDSEAVMLVHSYGERVRIVQDYNLNPEQQARLLTVAEVLVERHRGRKPSVVLVDNAERIIYEVTSKICPYTDVVTTFTGILSDLYTQCELYE